MVDPLLHVLNLKHQHDMETLSYIVGPTPYLLVHNPYVLARAPEQLNHSPYVCVGHVALCIESHAIGMA